MVPHQKNCPGLDRLEPFFFAIPPLHVAAEPARRPLTLLRSFSDSVDLISEIERCKAKAKAESGCAFLNKGRHHEIAENYTGVTSRFVGRFAIRVYRDERDAREPPE